MKILVIVRTKNEERYIRPFLESYLAFCDGALVADGGSTDRTKEIASEPYFQSSGVKVRDFEPRILIDAPEVWMNPEGEHINFLIRWAGEEEADWVVFEDCDARPNRNLRRAARTIMEITRAVAILTPRVYWYKDKEYMTALGKVNGEWHPLLWAWRLDSGIHSEIGTGFAYTFTPDPTTLPHLDLHIPLARNHHFYDDAERVRAKTAAYRAVSKLPHLDPMEFGGPLAPLPDWTRED